MLHVACGMAIAALVLPHLKPSGRRCVVRRWSAQILDILNVKLSISGRVPDARELPVLFVANHVSWIDVWVINSINAVRFVAKDELRSWPALGWLSEKAGTLFIRRARRHDTSRIAAAVAETLRGGECVCVFPEGTTTDGTFLYPFKSSLLQPAISTGVPVWPIALRYQHRDGSPNTAVNYAGETTLAQSLRAILGQSEILIQLDFAPPIPSADGHRRQLAKRAEQAIASLARLSVRAAPGTASGPPDAPH